MNVVFKRNIELAKMLYEQSRYKEAEAIIGNNLVNAEARYIKGKICARTGREEEAKEWFYSAIDRNYKWIAPRLALAKLFVEEGSMIKAEKEYEVCLNREPQNTDLKIEVAKFYISIDENTRAKALVDKALKLKPNDEKTLKKALEVYDKMQEYKEMYDISEKLMLQDSVMPNEYRTLETMARTYYNFEKYEKALKVFKCKTINQPMTRIIENLYKRRIYCQLSDDKEKANMYQTILANLEEAYGEEGRLKHIEKHLKNNCKKEKHGVFVKELPEIMEIIKNSKKTKQNGKDCDIYCIKAEGCGYEGGSQGDGHKLDYITLITMKDTEKPITIFPSDKIVFNLAKANGKEECKDAEYIK